MNNTVAARFSAALKITPSLAEKLAKAGVRNDQDILLHMPLRYEDETRITPVVDSSPYLSELVSGDVDNSSVKRFSNSYLYLKGCQVDRQAISEFCETVQKTLLGENGPSHCG